MLLPLIGVFLAIVPPVLLLLIQVPPSEALFRLVLLVFLLGAAQHVVLNLLAPRIFGHHMGIPTLLLFAALLLGAREGGVWGAFFAGPVVAVGYAMIEVIDDRWSATSPLFQPDNDQAGDEEAARRLNGNGENGTALTDSRRRPNTTKRPGASEETRTTTEERRQRRLTEGEGRRERRVTTG